MVISFRNIAFYAPERVFSPIFLGSAGSYSGRFLRLEGPAQSEIEARLRNPVFTENRVSGPLVKASSSAGDRALWGEGDKGEN